MYQISNMFRFAMPIEIQLKCHIDCSCALFCISSINIQLYSSFWFIEEDLHWFLFQQTILHLAESVEQNHYGLKQTEIVHHKINNVYDAQIIAQLRNLQLAILKLQFIHPLNYLSHIRFAWMHCPTVYTSIMCT